MHPLTKSSYYLVLTAALLLFFGARLEFISLYGSQSPYWDDWGLGNFLTRILNSEIGLGQFFGAANEHRMVFNRTLNLILFNLNHQQWDPLVSMVANSFIWAVTGTFLVRLALKHSASVSTPVLLVVLFALFIFPLSMVNVLWGIQTHTYTMILFSLLGCWYITYQPLTIKWSFGVLCLLACGFTLAGGTFVGFACAATYAVWAVIDRQQRKPHLVTFCGAAFAGLVGLAMILSLETGTSLRPSIKDAATSFLLAMSWPNSTLIWPALITALPILLLTIQVFKQRSTPVKLARFSLSLFTFLTLVSLAIAYARGYGGYGPAPRYYEFLALLPISSLIAYLSLQKPATKSLRILLGGFFAVWMGMFIVSFNWLTEVTNNTVRDQAKLKPIQEELLRTYLNTKDASVLKNKPPRHVPFPQAKPLIEALDRMHAADTLPYLLQTPEPVVWNASISDKEKEQSAFVENGTFFPSQNKSMVDRLGEAVIGSYKPALGGVRATGKFESHDIKINRSYAAFPVSGYLGYKGMAMKLVDVGTGEEFNIKPRNLNSKYAERWRTLIMPIPRGYYRIVAEDQNPALWFAFAPPRSVGRLSYYTHRILEYADWLWKMGLFILLLSMTRIFTAQLREPNSAPTSN